MLDTVLDTRSIAKRLALDNADATGYSPSKAAWLDARAPLGAAIPHIHAIGPSVPLPHAQVWEGSVTPPVFTASEEQ